MSDEFHNVDLSSASDLDSGDETFDDSSLDAGNNEVSDTNADSLPNDAYTDAEEPINDAPADDGGNEAIDDSGTDALADGSANDAPADNGGNEAIDDSGTDALADGSANDAPADNGRNEAIDDSGADALADDSANDAPADDGGNEAIDDSGADALADDSANDAPADDGDNNAPVDDHPNQEDSRDNDPMDLGESGKKTDAADSDGKDTGTESPSSDDADNSNKEAADPHGEASDDSKNPLSADAGIDDGTDASGDENGEISDTDAEALPDREMADGEGDTNTPATESPELPQTDSQEPEQPKQGFWDRVGSFFGFGNNANDASAEIPDAERGNWDGMETAPQPNGNGWTVLPGNHFDNFKDVDLNYEDHPYTNLMDTGNDYMATVDPADIEGVYLGDSEIENPDNFWGMHGGSKDAWMETASHIPDVQAKLDNGESLDSLLNDEELGPCANAYFNPNHSQAIQVDEMADGGYLFNSNGRHRIIAARAQGHSIPVRVVGRRD